MPVARKNASDPMPYDDEETTNGGFAFAGWGFATVVALTLGIASWQYAPPRTMPYEVARAEVQLPDPTETGSVPRGDRPPVAQPARVVGADRVSPMPLAADVQLATSRDIDQLRTEIRELQRRLGQAGLSGDGLSRRLDRLEERIAVDPAVARDRLARLVGPGERSDPPKPEPSKPEAAKPEPGKVEAVKPTVDRIDPAKPVEPPKAALERIEAKPAEPPKVVEKPAEPAPAPAAVVDRVPAQPEKLDRLIVERIPVPAARPTDVPDPAPVRTAKAVPSAPAPTGETDGPATTGTVARTNSIPVTPPVVVAAAPPPPAATQDTPPVAPKGDLLAAPAKSDPSAVAAKADGFTLPTAVMPASSEPPAAIDLGGYRSLATLRKAWTDLSGRNSELGRGLAPLARLKETESGIEARLLVGPFPNQTEAAKSCMRLRAAGVACSVGVYSGQAVLQR
jgi:hypothetical protein